MTATVIDVARQAQIAREREAVVAAAREWIGTPFHHAARVKGSGVDCSQLLIAVYSDELALVPPIETGEYPPDWFLHRDLERIQIAMLEHTRRMSSPLPGDIALFKYGRTVSHSAIVVQGAPHVRVVHSFTGFGVTETEVEPGHHLYTRLVGWWTLKRWLTEADL